MHIIIVYRPTRKRVVDSRRLIGQRTIRIGGKCENLLKRYFFFFNPIYYGISKESDEELLFKISSPYLLSFPRPVNERYLASVYNLIPNDGDFV